MRVAERVARARRALVATLLLSTVARAVAGGVALLLVLGLVDLATPLSLGVRRAAVPLSLLAGVALLGILLYRGRHAFRLGRVALYLEEQKPELEFALVTALETTGPGAAALEQAVDRAGPDGLLRGPLTRALGASVLLLALPLAGLATLPASARERLLHPVPGDALLVSRAAGPAASRLGTVAVRVMPPAYARRPEQRLADPATVAGLVGSRVEIRGRGASVAATDSLAATLGEQRFPASAVGDTWTVTLRMPDQPAAVRLTDRQFSRLLALEPVLDRPPVVTLTAPSRDTTYLLPKGRLVLAGSAGDDIGLVRAEFELMHTTGSGERFDITRRTLGGVSPGGALTAAVQATLLLDTMKLGPGDVLHVRVVARDANDLTGPGEGASDTRTIRIADPRSRDTVEVVPAAVAALDTTMLSQRMLVIRAETLLVQRRRITAKAFEDRSKTLGQQQGMLRERVEAVIEELENATEVGFTGETEASRILGEAAGAMKLAQRELGMVRVQDALPHMYRALKALEKLRNAERLYLRGVFPKLVVDLDKIRLKGTDKPSVGSRESRPELPDPRRILGARLDRALTLLRRGDPGVRDTLVLIRVEALTQAAEAAPALSAAIEALRAGRDPSPSVAIARRVLLRSTEGSPGIPAWRGTP